MAVSVHGGSLRLLLTERRRVLSWAEVPFNPALMRGGFVGDKSGMSQVIKNALATKGMPPAPATAAFPGFQSIVRVIRLPSALGARPHQVLLTEARRLMAFSDREQFLFWQPATTAGKFRNFVVVSVPKTPIQTFVETLKLAGLRPSRIELAPLCLMKILSPGQALLANVENDSIDIVIMVESLPALVRSLWLGNEPLTIDSAPSRLAEELLNTISFYDNANPESRLPPTLPIHLAGGFPVDELAPVVARETGHPVTPLMAPLPAPEGFPATAMAVAAGLIWGG